MIGIEPSGSFFPMDADGHILNPTKLESIQPIYLPLIDALIAACQAHLGDRLLAVFLRGTVARGLARPFYSDLDAVAVVQPLSQVPFSRWATPSWVEAVAAELVRQHPFVPQLDLAVADYDAAFPGANWAVKFVLKTQGLCVWGEDITQSWPDFKLGRSIAFNYRWLHYDYTTWQQDWAQQPDSLGKRAFLQSFCKTVLRTGFELVMEREGKFTVDLYPCYTSFCKHFPDQAPLMAAALETFLNPSHAAGLGWMEELVPFLVNASGVSFGEHFPPDDRGKS